MKNIIEEKLKQAPAVLKEKQVDLWLTFVRETSLTPDPAASLIFGENLTSQTALIITSKGDTIAVVGNLDTELVRPFYAVERYNNSINEPLADVIRRLSPSKIALNFSDNDPSADGLTYGMFLRLNDIIKSSGVNAEIVSAEHIIRALRGRKNPLEISLLREAALVTGKILDALGEKLYPGIKDLEIAQIIKTFIKVKCPNAFPAHIIITAGKDAYFGHTNPSGRMVNTGELLQADLGLRLNGFCSDLQRTWFFAERDKKLPDDVKNAQDALFAAFSRGLEMIRPGVKGYEVDFAARECLKKAGYAEYQHAFGHQVGREVHDGGTKLGRKLEKYRTLSEEKLEQGNVFAVEISVQALNRGWIGIEECVLVTDNGYEFLSKPADNIILL